MSENKKILITRDTQHRLISDIKEIVKSPLTDQGIYYAFNKGMNLSTGKYICIVNSDDKLTPKALTIIDKYLVIKR